MLTLKTTTKFKKDYKRMKKQGKDMSLLGEVKNGTIVLEPRELTVPFEVSANTLSMMDQSVQNFRAGKVSEPVDLSAFEE
jgi:pyridoxal biosynthesis lyase PdxS